MKNNEEIKPKIVLMSTTYNNSLATCNFLQSINELAQETEFPYELVYVLRDDGSDVMNRELISGFASDKKMFVFSQGDRNLGQSMSNAQLAQVAPQGASAYVFLDSDGDEPLEELMKLLNIWRQEKNVSIVGVMNAQSTHKSTNSWASGITWRFLSWLQDDSVVASQTTLRVIDSRYWESYKKSLILFDGYLGLAQTLSGIPTHYVQVTKSRGAGSSYNFARRLKLAMRLASVSPGIMVKLASFSSAFGVIVGVILFCWFIIYGLSFRYLPGYASLGASVVGLLSIVLFIQGRILLGQFRLQRVLYMSPPKAWNHHVS